MARPFHEVQAEALELTVRERGELILSLIRSLDEGRAEDQAATDQAWDDEIRRRVSEIDAGTAE